MKQTNRKLPNSSGRDRLLATARDLFVSRGASNVGINDVTDTAGKLVRQVNTEPVAQGRWNVLLAGLPAGAYDVSAQAHEQKTSHGHAAFAIPTPQPFTRLTADDLLLKKLESFADLATQNANALPAQITAYIDLRPLLITAAILLFVVHVAMRRWSLFTRPAHKP